MTTLAEAKQRILAVFLADFTATTNITLDGEKYNPPTDDNWVRVAIRHTSRSQESLGSVGRRKFESVGSVFVQCFSPLDSGSGSADTMAAAAQNVFEGKLIGTTERLRFTSAAITEVGPTDDWYQINVEAFFTYTETK